MPPKSKTKHPKQSSKVAKARKVKAKSRQSPEARFKETVAKKAISVGAAEDKLTEVVRAGVARTLREPGPAAIGRVYHLDRGFDRLEEKLRKCGAQIERLAD